MSDRTHDSNFLQLTRATVCLLCSGLCYTVPDAVLQLYNIHNVYDTHLVLQCNAHASRSKVVGIPFFGVHGRLLATDVVEEVKTDECVLI